ncbi:unnamed protein product [Dibothriocephalus latus]|uniref:Uncharacterized protein n=1 Tax=Dibothriocephalus latus TaxID=60516 RepID=A0A3P7LJM5_DIBLA|nr:unnamed protein product [Dibothriocephalus latus]
MNDELLPLDFRQLIELCKRNSGFREGLDEEYLNMILSRVYTKRKPTTADSHTDGGLSQQTNGQSSSPQQQNYSPMHSIISQAQLLLTPLGDDFTSEPYIIPCDESNPMETDEGDQPADVDMLEDESAAAARPPVAAKCPQETVQALEPARPSAAFFEERGIDEELPLTEHRKSTSTTSARFYQFRPLYCLSAPYQEPMTAGRPVYLYTWSLPHPNAVVRLTNVEASCFKHVDQTIGLIFSKPITKVGS